MRNPVKVLILAICTLFPTCTASETTQTKTWELCDILHDLQKLNGKTVRIRGLISQGRHGSYMSDCRLGGCSGMPETENRSNLLFVVTTEGSLAGVSTTTRDSSLGGPPSFRTDESSNRIGEVMRKVRDWQVVALVEGEVRTRQGLGYGQLNMCPGVLILKTVIEARERPMGKGLKSLCDPWPPNPPQ